MHQIGLAVEWLNLRMTLLSGSYDGQIRPIIPEYLNRESTIHKCATILLKLALTLLTFSH